MSVEGGNEIFFSFFLFQELIFQSQFIIMSGYFSQNLILIFRILLELLDSLFKFFVFLGQSIEVELILSFAFFLALGFILEFFL